MCVFTDPGTVPLSWQRIVEADPDLANDHVICRKSGLYRPLRSHFCSVTRRVVLNMCAPLLLRCAPPPPARASSLPTLCASIRPRAPTAALSCSQMPMPPPTAALALHICDDLQGPLLPLGRQHGRVL